MTTAASKTSFEVAAPMKLTEVYSVTDPNLAEIIKAALQQSGISCWIDGENQAGLSGILKIRLLTRAKDVDPALRIIRSYDH